MRIAQSADHGFVRHGLEAARDNLQFRTTTSAMERGLDAQKGGGEFTLLQLQRIRKRRCAQRDAEPVFADRAPVDQRCRLAYAFAFNACRQTVCPRRGVLQYDDILRNDDLMSLGRACQTVLNGAGHGGFQCNALAGNRQPAGSGFPETSRFET